MSTTVAADRVPFADFCSLCEHLSGAPSRPRRIELWRRFLDRYRTQVSPTGGDSAYTLLRLLLPDRDRQRGPYGAKHHRLAELYTAALSLPRASQAAAQLLGYRSSGSVQHGGGDFGETLQHVLQNRCPAQDSGWSMKRVDDTLTQLAEQNQANERSAMQQTMRQLVQTLSAREHKWLVRIILKEMHLGVDSGSLLTAFHPDAADHYSASSCLRRLATELADPGRRLTHIQIRLFTAFRPMLSERSGLDRVDKQMKNKPFYVEPKHDGERVQLHKDGDRYMFFSRGGFDFTASFGASPREGTLVPHIHPQFSDTVRSCILDGEMLVWNDIEKRIIVKAEAPDVKKLKPGGRIRPMFVPFDLVFLNGVVLTERPLRERLEKLQSVFCPLEGRLDVTTRLEASTTEEVVEALNAAIDRQEEGLVLKDPLSLYRPNARRAGWAKVKPDYVDSLVDDLDMLIIGGFYGAGARRGAVCQFLLGAAERPEQEGETPQLFLSAGTVSSGLTDQQLMQLQQQLMPHFRQTRRDGRPPPALRWGAEKPDLWIEPANSQILQVKATEIVESTRHSAGLVPRFARVVAVRSDKHWHESITTAELRELRNKAGGKLATAHLKGVPQRAAGGGRASTSSAAVAPHLRPADLTGVQPVSALLRQRQLCVMTCSSPSDKADLERLVHQCGGTLTQNPTPSTWCVVADKLTVKERSVVASGRYDVVRSGWVRRVHSARRLLPFSPSELLHATAQTRQDTLLHYDRFGDSYTEDVTEQELKKMLEAMPCDSAPSPPPPPELADLLSADRPPFSTLAGCRCFLAPPLHGATIAGLTLRLHGGRLSGALDGRVTHVVVTGSSAAGGGDDEDGAATDNDGNGDGTARDGGREDGNGESGRDGGRDSGGNRGRDGEREEGADTDGGRSGTGGGDEVSDRDAQLKALKEENRRRTRKFHLVSERWVEECARRGQRAEERAFPP